MQKSCSKWALLFFPFILCSTTYTQELARTEDQTHQSHSMMIPFLPGPCSASVLPTLRHTDAQSFRRLKMFSPVESLSLLNPYHFIHHLPN